MKNANYYILNRLTLLTGNHICIVKSQQLVDSASKLLGTKNDLTNALGLYTLAVEEFGKAVLLKECYVNKEIPQMVPKKIFSDHELKFKKALHNLPKVCKEIMVGVRLVFPSGSYKTIQIGKFGPKISIAPNTSGSFFAKYAANFDVRMNCFYVNWDDKQKRWAFNLEVEKKDLKRAMKTFKKHAVKYDIVNEIESKRKSS